MDTLIQRDMHSLGRILDTLPALLRATASRTARLHNLSGLAPAFELCRPPCHTARGTLPDRTPSGLVQQPPEAADQEPETPLTDSGLAAALPGIDAGALERDRTRLGQLLETLVFQDLRRQASWHAMLTGFSHFRDRDGTDVDIVLEHLPGAVARVEVKASATVRSGDFRGLRRLRNALGQRFTQGAVPWDGEAALPFGERLHALPVSRLWQAP